MPMQGLPICYYMCHHSLSCYGQSLAIRLSAVDVTARQKLQGSPLLVHVMWPGTREQGGPAEAPVPDD